MNFDTWSKFVKKARWYVVAFFVLFGMAWYANQPTYEQLQRQKQCESWGVKDSNELAKCRESYAAASAIIAPIRRPFIERAIAEFNRDLAKLAVSRTLAPGDYGQMSMRDLEKLTGGIIQISNQAEVGNFPSNGRRVAVNGTIAVNDPDKEDGSGMTQQYFEIQGQTDQPNTLPPTVYLDIESLNRNERQFIRDHCDAYSVTPCRTTVLGHIGETVETRTEMFSDIGLVADQIDIQPLDWASADQDGVIPLSAMKRN